MGKKIEEIRQSRWIPEQRPKVAAYARVSSGKDAMLHSLAAQIDYYKSLILGNMQWEFAGVFADEAKTGTRENRDGFQALLRNCRAGNVDMIITKSISRFARNTVTLLKTVRELKSIGVDVFFEEQNIHTMSAECEVMLTLLASFAQAESLSVSENCKWRIRRGFEEGKPSTCRMLGYRLINGRITLVPEEAVTVKRIFDLYLQGFGVKRIANTLNDEGRGTVNGGQWGASSVAAVLRNEKYCGDLILQKYFVTDHISKTKVLNVGQLHRFLIENNHEPIVDRNVFQAVAAEIKRRSAYASTESADYALTGMIVCSCCGKHYRRKITAGRVKWCCGTYQTKGKRFCPESKMIPEETIVAAICETLGFETFDETRFKNRIERIEAHPGNVLRFIFHNGDAKDYLWADRSRAESWTPEMKAAASLAARRGKSDG